MERYLHGSLNGDKGRACIENDYPYVGLPKDEWYDQTVDANNINGIDLVGDDLDSFWRQHGHSKEEYTGIASHLPEVNARLDAAEAEGKTREEALEECRGVEELAPCVKAYYDDPVNVAALDDTYMATGDGRHRILAAQEVGAEMPVKVRGEYLNNDVENGSAETTGEKAEGFRENKPQGEGENMSNYAQGEGETMRSVADQEQLPEIDRSNGQENTQTNAQQNETTGSAPQAGQDTMSSAVEETAKPENAAANEQKNDQANEESISR